MRAPFFATALVVLAAALAPQTAMAAPGDLDNSWDGDGIRADSGGSDPDVAVAPDGKVVVSTGFTNALLRYNPNGSLDTSFDGDGVALTQDRPRAIAIQSDGKILVVGGLGGDFWLARFNTNGTPDTGFQGDGDTTMDLGGDDTADAVVIQSGGRILLAGNRDSNEFALARFTDTGAPDNSFDTDGQQLVDFGGANEFATGVAVQRNNGRIVVVGRSDGDFALAGLTDGGALDGAFGVGGKRTTDFGGFDTAEDVAIDSSNRVVVVGDTASDFFAIARYTATGTLDPSCDNDGTLTVDFGENFQVANDVAMQFNDKFVVAGTSNDDFSIARLLPNDCALDTGFAGDGKFTEDGNGNGFDSVAIQPGDGKILAAGSSAGEPGDIVTMRLQGDEPPPPPQPQPEPEPEPQPQPNPCANDRSGPEVTIRSLQNRALYRQNQSPASVRIEASDPSGLAVDPSNPARGIATSTVGVHSATATARDNCGNETTTVFRYRVAGEPAIQIAGVTSSCRTANFRVTIRVRGDVSITRITARLRGRLVGQASGSRLTVTIPIRSLRPGGRYVLTVAARDRAGNLSTDQVDFARCVVVQPTFTG